MTQIYLKMDFVVEKYAKYPYVKGILIMICKNSNIREFTKRFFGILGSYTILKHILFLDLSIF